MGLNHLFHGVTFECFEDALTEKPKIVHCMIEEKKLSRAEIDKIFSARTIVALDENKKPIKIPH